MILINNQAHSNEPKVSGGPVIEGLSTPCLPSYSFKRMHNNWSNVFTNLFYIVFFHQFIEV
ncbi:hypothetical protein PRUB_b0832 [Pseudoalteromonas rubra]|uniref:Uncharacterized protein n=1 Tax=Pseudoalteromonas rubra TaxID=43658 RepID=A0A8T0C105_9GAMM|nr:hypothetical protein PRUB_b0832 [Pseudoalteromonas rubra]